MKLDIKQHPDMVMYLEDGDTVRYGERRVVVEERNDEHILIRTPGKYETFAKLYVTWLDCHEFPEPQVEHYFQFIRLANGNAVFTRGELQQAQQQDELFLQLPFLA